LPVVVPGKAMPAFDRLAYTDKRCYDMTAEDWDHALGGMHALL